MAATAKKVMNIQDVEMVEASDNVIMEVEDNILTITVDLTQSFGLSSSGKSETIASTLGNQPVPGFPQAKIGLNIYKPVKKTK